MKDYSYIAIVTTKENGFMASFYDFPKDIICGENIDEIMNGLFKLININLTKLVRNGEELPEPSKIEDIKLDDNSLAVQIEVTIKENV